MLPDTFVSRLQNWLGSEWTDFVSSFQNEPNKAIRLHRVSLSEDTSTNYIKTQVMADNGPFAIGHRRLPAPRILHELQSNPVPWMEDAYYIQRDHGFGKSIYHEMGAYYIQEPSAMAVVSALSPQPGERILDLCAAPGGKTTAIGRALNGLGTLAANEIHPTRVVVLGQNLERTGVPALITNETPDRLASKWVGQFDAVLVDAPCSGEGMFRKDPGAAHSWTPDAPEMCAVRQRDILPSAISMVRPGGRLVYSTCTFNPTENEKIVLWMLRNFPVRLQSLPDWPGWEPGRPEWADDEEALLKTRRLWPHKGKGEGHFVALFEVYDSLTLASTQPSSAEKGRAAKVPLPKGFGEWLEDMIQQPIPAYWRESILHKNVIYTDETGGLPITGLKVLRPGVCLASAQKNRFEPHHQLAMALWNSVPRNIHELSEGEAKRYMAGEAISPAPNSGIYWLHIGGIPVGWGKSVPGRMNNLYPKGLRRADLVGE